MAPKAALSRSLDALARLHGEPRRPPTVDPFELTLWENVAYLVNDERRAAAFDALEERVGLAPHAIASARRSTLVAVAHLGGIHAELRADRLVECAQLALELGDLKRALSGDGAAARRVLRRFPAIGEPGAGKILLFAGLEPVLALDSNGLRTLLRLGYGVEQKSYASSYRSARDAASAELGKTCRVLLRAHQLLRTHGQTLCRRTEPHCGECPLASSCAHAASFD